MLATLNFGVASSAEVSHAIAKLDDAGDPEGYFTRVASLAMRTSWGRYPDAPKLTKRLRRKDRSPSGSRCSWRIDRSGDAAGPAATRRRHSIRLPAVDRLALEMAANEDIERSALMGELDALHAAWKDAEEIAAIADELFADGVLEEFKRQYYDRIAAAEESLGRELLDGAAVES